MILNLMPRPIVNAHTIPYNAQQINARVAPNCSIRNWEMCYYGPVDFGDGVVTNYVPAVYPVGYTGRYSLTNRTSCITLAAVSTVGQQYPSEFVDVLLPSDMQFESTEE